MKTLNTQGCLMRYNIVLETLNEYSVRFTMTNCTSTTSSPTTIDEGGSRSITFSAASGCKMSSTAPTVTGATVTSWIVSTVTTVDDTAILTLGNPTGDVSFTVEGEETELCFTANTAGSTVELTIIGSPSISNTAYSTDRVNWTTFTPSTTAGTNTITLTNVGDKVYFRNDITANLSSSDYMKFVMSGSISASGNINSMYDADGFSDLTTLSYNYCYRYMFRNCTSLTTAPSLPATTLADYCYSSMFRGCTLLTTAPALPATTLADYCYFSMFSGCTSLTTAPALPATTLAEYCYSEMFSGCTSLTTAPSLPATTLADYCYSSMFRGCTLLTTAPALPATTLASRCYSSMFFGCTSLTTAPALPATTLADYCYFSMFSGCTSLTTAPALPATTLASYCYPNMFYDCTSLYVSDTQTSVASYEWHIPTSGTFTNTTTYNQNNMFSSCLGTRSSDTLSGAQGESHTYYTQNQQV